MGSVQSIVVAASIDSLFVFFFQAEDGIRDLTVTGVQTCALPIFPFILSALAFTRVTGIFRFFRKHYSVITVVSGVVLVAMGVALYTDQLSHVNSWLNDLGLNGISNL